MNGCPTLGPEGSAGIAAALRVVDCYTAKGTASAFGRLFGPDGALGVALTILLTIYVALLAVNLLTGRSRLSLNMLTPRMLGLGLVLTFATSWVAYQSVVWTLLTGAPDQIASVVTGADGSATAAFAQQLDKLFAAVARAADAAASATSVGAPTPVAIGPDGNPTGPAPAAVATANAAAGWTPSDVLWMAAMLLLLGTVGVLLVARIALAALLALGPVFVVMALFRGTHGLFVGWLKAAVMFAVVPMFTVLIGGAAVMVLTPVVIGLNAGPVTMQGAVTMFLGAAVYVALMVMVLKLCGTLVSGWRIDRGGDDVRGETSAAAAATPATQAAIGATGTAATVAAATAGAPVGAASQPVSDRVRSVVTGIQAPANDPGPGPASGARVRGVAGAMPSFGASGAAAFKPTDRRVAGVGGRFRAPAPTKDLPRS